MIKDLLHIYNKNSAEIKFRLILSYNYYEVRFNVVSH